MAGPGDESIYEEVVAFQFRAWVGYKIGYGVSAWKEVGIVNKVDITADYGSYTLRTSLASAQGKFWAKGLYTKLGLLLPDDMIVWVNLQDFITSPYLKGWVPF